MNKTLSLNLLSAIVLLLSACGGGGSIEPEVKVEPVRVASAKYGAHERHAATLYQPKGEAKGLILWVHGGGWIGGDKDGDFLMFDELVADGSAVLSMNYRLNADGVFPGSVHDVQKVLDVVDGGDCPECTNMPLWERARDIAKTKGVMTSGSSAGGYLSVYGAAEHVQRNALSSVKCIGGAVFPVDFRDMGVYDPEVASWLLVPYAGGNLSPSHLAKMSPAAQLESGAWQNSMTRSWHMIFTDTDYFIPFATTYGAVNYLKDSGVKLNHIVLKGDENAGGHKVKESDATVLFRKIADDCFY